MSGDLATARVDLFTAKRDDLRRLDPVDGPAAAGWPCLDSSTWSDGLDRLVAEISGRDLTEFGDHELVFPDRAAGDWEGPWLVRVPDDVVDAFAVLSHDEIVRYARRAALADDLAERAAAVAELCRRAHDAHDDVYQWSTD